MKEEFIYTKWGTPDESFIEKKYVDEHGNEIGTIVDYTDLSITVEYHGWYNIKKIFKNIWTTIINII